MGSGVVTYTHAKPKAVNPIPPDTRGATLAELVVDRRERTNPVTRHVLSDIIARRVYKGEAGRWG